jgi:hypothetical protein
MYKWTQACYDKDRTRDTTRETAHLELLPRLEAIASTSWLRKRHVGTDKGWRKGTLNTNYMYVPL